ncbi:MAG: N-6 DNA methylase [Thermoplasmatales archaeon]|nr:N-6 DNA methylase [Candidatus Methanoperedenaceae archaeon]MCG2826977.1 N-6 DNA methylase [Thermoplasmatales archaeon]
MVETTLGYVENKGLFSNHYLENQLFLLDEWKRPGTIEEKFSKIKALYQSQESLFQNADEAQLRAIFIDHVLKEIGHYHTFGGKIEGTAKRPDYGLFPDENSLKDAIKHQDTEDFYKKAIGLCEAKAWSIKLDERDPKNIEPDKRTPNSQIDDYLHRSGKKWGILTNGRFWRLYYRENSYRNYFYHVDLAQIIEKDDVSAFKYFYLFFRKEAFEVDVINVCFLDRVYQGSVDYAKDIGKNLEENVYKAMKTLAEGFINLDENKLTKTEKDLKDIQENTMILLYRLLFIFFAEANALLDLSNKTYKKSYSLYSVKEKIADQIKQGDSIPKYSYTYWGKLDNLFKLINMGTLASGIPKVELYIPSYNGGLFDPEKNEFLVKNKIGDSYIADAIDLLARYKGKKPEEKGFIDYSSLDIRHLGSIYEGLLEYKLKLATEPMVAVKEKGKEKWIPSSEFKGKKYIIRVDANEIYLATDKGERKATGSYYTPEYIVKYIVENTLTPIVNEKMKKAIENNEKCSDAILSIKVLDPAMGSGHFLVEVVDFLAHHLSDAINKDIEGGLIEEYEYSDDWLRRGIVSHCIYGVDMNPMAVELAKVSLWLKTISKDKPLSFLDHRLKCGNSLIGTKLIELKDYPNTKKNKSEIIDKSQQKFEVVIPKPFIEQIQLNIKKLVEISDESLENIKKKEKLFEDLKNSPEFQRIKLLSDIRTSIYFGAQIGAIKHPKDVYNDLLWETLRGSNETLPEIFGRVWVKNALKIANQRRFFHWELEFPEIFFEEGKLKENPGFDAVVGNPPYIESKQLTKEVKDEIKHFYTSGIGKFDMYIPFIERGLQLLSNFGFFAYICPSMFMKRDYGESIRNVISKESDIVEIIDFQDLQSFGDVTNFVIILLLTKRQIPIASYINLKSIGVKPSELPNLKKEHFTQIPQEFFTDAPWVFVNSGDNILINKIKSKSNTLEYITERISVGIQTGKDEVFLINDKEFNNLKLEKNIWRDLLRGRDIDRWVYSACETKVFYPYGDDNKLISEDNLKSNYPFTYNYLLGKRDLLAGRSYFDKSNKKWYELWCERDINIFKCKTKILVQEISDKNNFCIDTEGLFYNTKVFGITLDKNVTESYSFMLALLNSKLLEFSFKKTSVPKAGGFYEYKTQFLNFLPIRRISFTTSRKERTKLLDEAKRLYYEELNKISGGD